MAKQCKAGERLVGGKCVPHTNGREECTEDEIFLSKQNKCVSKEDVSVQELADEFYRFFTTKTRPDGTTFVTRKEDAPEALKEIIYEAHGGMLPDDYKYEFIHESLEHISDTDTPDEPELEADVYTGDLLKWLGSHMERTGYVDEAIREFGKRENLEEDMMAGQVMEKEEVYHTVLRGLRDLLEHD